MLSELSDIEKDYLLELELLSRQISDFISENKFAEIPLLDKKRMEIIKYFKGSTNKNIKNNLQSLLIKNNDEILLIEKKKNTLHTENIKFINRFKAYT